MTTLISTDVVGWRRLFQLAGISAVFESRPTKSCLLTLLSIVLLAANATAAAAEFTVTTSIDRNNAVCDPGDCSLREAIAAANFTPGPDTITVPTGTYALNNALGSLQISDDVTIDASAAHVVIDGDSVSPIFIISAGATASLIGGTMRGDIVSFNDPLSSLAIAGGTVTLLGEVVTGNMSYEVQSGDTVVEIDNASFLFGLNEGQAGEVGILIDDASGAAVEVGLGMMAGLMVGNSSLVGTSAQLNGTLEYRYNDTGTAINRIVNTGSGDLLIDFATQNSVRQVSGNGNQIGLNNAPPLATDMLIEHVDLAGSPAIGFALTGGSLSLASGVVAATDGQGFGLLSGGGILAMSVSALTALSAPGVSLNGLAAIEINSSAAFIDESFVISGSPVLLTVPPGPRTNIRVSGGSIGLIDAPPIFGDLNFEQVAVDSGDAAIVTITNGSWSLGGSQISATNFEGIGLFLNTGQFLMSLPTPVNAAIPDVTLQANQALLQLNSQGTFADVQFDFGGETINISLPAGPFSRMEIPGGGFAFPAGATITADLTLEEIEVATTPATSVIINDGEFLMAGNNVAAFNLTGAAVVLNNGDFGLSGNGSLALMPAESELNGAGTLNLNLSDSPIIVSPLSLNLAAGPFLRVQAVSANIGLTNGPPVQSDLVIEERSLAGGTGAVVSVSNGSLSLGNGNLQGSDLQGLGLVLPSGQLALLLPGNFSFNTPGLTLNSTVAAEINSTSAAVSETFNVGGSETTFELPAGPYTRVTAENSTFIADGFGNFSGNFRFDEIASESQQILRVRGNDVITNSGEPGLNGESLNGSVLPDSSYSVAAETEDPDADGFASSTDNCPNDFNPFQTDGDNDGVGDACETVKIPAVGSLSFIIFVTVLGFIGIIRLRSSLPSPCPVRKS